MQSCRLHAVHASAATAICTTPVAQRNGDPAVDLNWASAPRQLHHASHLQRAPRAAAASGVACSFCSVDARRGSPSRGGARLRGKWGAGQHHWPSCFLGCMPGHSPAPEHRPCKPESLCHVHDALCMRGMRARLSQQQQLHCHADSAGTATQALAGEVLATSALG